MLASLLVSGCLHSDPEKGYTTASAHPQDIRTVFVEMIQSESFRRDVEFDLSRTLVSRLELASPYKVVSDRGRADTVLSGVVTRLQESVLTRQRDLDRPIESQTTLVVEVSWQDLRSGKFYLDGHRLTVRADYEVLSGASRKNAARDAAQETAARIVEAMEQTW